MKQSKKILLVSPWAIADDSVGGTERFIIDLASGLAEEGHLVDVLMMSGKDHTTKSAHYYSLDIFGEGIDANEYAYQRLFNRGLSKELLTAFAQKIEVMFDASTYDIVQLNSLLFLYLFTNVERIFVIHTNPYELTLDWGKDGFSRVVSMVASDALQTDTFVAPSKYYAQGYSKLLERKVHTIPHSIDAARLQTQLTKDEILAKYGIDDKYIFLVPSRLDFKQKRPQIALEAIASIANKLPDFEVVFTGLDSQYKEYADILHKRAAKYNLTVRTVRFENAAEAYAIADVVILPSRSESFGYSALEAMVLERKVVMNAIPTFKEIKEGGMNTFMFKQTTKELAEGILEAVNSDKPRHQKNEWKKRYSKAKWVKDYESLMKASQFHDPSI